MTKCYILRAFGLFIVLCYLSSCGFTPSEQNSTLTNQDKRQYVKGELPLQHGMELFNQYCASCHNFTDNGIGPNLAGITSEVDKDWLIAFIHNPYEVIHSGDVRAVKLYEKYKQYMPPFPTLKGKDIEDVLGFIHKFSEGEKRNKNNRPGGIINPVPEKIATSGLTLVLEEQFKVPPSSEVTPITRINKMNAIPGGRVFLHDLRGKFYEVKEGNQLTVYMDLATALPNFIDHPGKASGFGSWAFHPEFEQNGLFYTTHTEPAGTAAADYSLPDSIKVRLQSVLLEWKVIDPKASIFEGTHRELLRVDMVGVAHTFQEVTFNPLTKPNTPEYGLLYLGIGDGNAAMAGYPALCGTFNKVWGNVLRIDPDGNNGINGQYGIPSNNPFVANPDALGEVWAIGFRNPHRICWDETGSGKMFITNIGQHSLEEINLGRAGANYGWPNREGAFLFDVDANPELVYPIPVNDSGYTYPVVQYDHDEGNAISGGFVYAGKKVSNLKGKYLFGDISRGTLFYAEVSEMNDGQLTDAYRLNIMFNGELTDLSTVTQTNRVDLRIGSDQEGELYIMTKGNGGVYKVIDCRSGTGTPNNNL